jgi:acetylornithine aminotransferase
MPTYGRVPIALERGQGCRVWDVNGKEYLDALGGIAVNTLGHNHPKLVPALQNQLAKLIHTSNYYHVPGQETLAKLLTERSGMTNVFFCNTGLEANEAAIKIARKYGVDKGIAKPEIVVYDHAFHGRSIATMRPRPTPRCATASARCSTASCACRQRLRGAAQATAGNPNVVAVMMEPIQGEGGLHPMRVEYLQKVRALCDANGWLLMLDEVQAGMGRTGKWFAHQWAGISPT